MKALVFITYCLRWNRFGFVAFRTRYSFILIFVIKVLFTSSQRRHWLRLSCCYPPAVFSSFTTGLKKKKSFFISMCPMNHFQSPNTWSTCSAEIMSSFFLVLRPRKNQARPLHPGCSSGLRLRIEYYINTPAAVWLSSQISWPHVAAACASPGSARQ